MSTLSSSKLSASSGKTPSSLASSAVVGSSSRPHVLCSFASLFGCPERAPRKSYHVAKAGKRKNTSRSISHITCCLVSNATALSSGFCKQSCRICQRIECCASKNAPRMTLTTRFFVSSREPPWSQTQTWCRSILALQLVLVVLRYLLEFRPPIPTQIQKFVLPFPKILRILNPKIYPFPILHGTF
jgi:hypothetical protein